MKNLTFQRAAAVLLACTMIAGPAGLSVYAEEAPAAAVSETETLAATAQTQPEQAAGESGEAAQTVEQSSGTGETVTEGTTEPETTAEKTEETGTQENTGAETTVSLTLAPTAESAEAPAAEAAPAHTGTLITEAGKTYTQADVDGYDNIQVRGDVTFADVVFAAKTGSAVLVSGTAGITIEGTCSFTGAQNGAGIEVPEGAVLHLSGSGSLTAVGNAGTDDRSSGASGIGGTHTAGNSGKISISGLASLTAEGFGHHAAGIGSCENGSNVGGITIADTTIALVRGGFAQQHITGNYGKSDPEGGPAIGGGAAGGRAGSITISGSTVQQAVGGSKSAAIGAGYWGGNAVIKIENSTVNAVGGCTAAAIGLSRVNKTYYSAGAEINITDSSINAEGGDYGSGIGSGYNDGSVTDGLGTVSVTISGGSIEAVGGAGGAGIGGGYKGHNVAVDISGGASVTAVGGVLGETFDSGKLKKENAGAAGIGTGANGSGTFTGGSIAIADGCNVIAYSNGDKWAIDYENCTWSGITATVLQTRFERSYGAIVPQTPDSGYADTAYLGESGGSLTLGGVQVSVPAAYYSAAATVTPGSRLVSGSGTPAYASYLADKTNRSTASPAYAVANTLSSYDSCAFRPDYQPVKHTVSYAWSGSAPSDAALPQAAQYAAGDAVTIAAAPTTAQPYWTFTGWTPSAGFTMDDADVTVTGTWRYDPPTWGGGGTVILPSASTEPLPSAAPSESASPEPTASIPEEPVPDGGEPAAAPTDATEQPSADIPEDETPRADSPVSAPSAPVTAKNETGTTIPDGETPTAAAPKTGDESGTALYALLALLGVAGLGGTAFADKKKRRGN